MNRAYDLAESEERPATTLWGSARRSRTSGCSRRGAVGGEPEHHGRPSHREPGQGRAPLAADPQCSTPPRVDNEAEAVPGVDTARRFGIPRTGCAAPTLWTAVTGYGRASRPGEQVHLVGLVPRPTSIGLGFHVRCHGARAGNRWPPAMFGGRRSLAGLAGSVMRAVPHPPGSRWRAPWSESGVRSGRVSGTAGNNVVGKRTAE